MAKGYLKEAMHLNYGGNVGFRNKPPLPGPKHGSRYTPPILPQQGPTSTNPNPAQPSGGVPQPAAAPPQDDNGGNNDLGYGEQVDPYQASRLGYEEGASGDLGDIGSAVGLITGIPGLGIAGNLADSQRAERGKFNSQAQVYGTQHTGLAEQGLLGAVAYDPISGNQSTGNGVGSFGDQGNLGAQFDGADPFGRSAAGFEGLGTHKGYQSISDLTNRNVKGFAPSSLQGLGDNEYGVQSQINAGNPNAAAGFQGNHESVRKIAQEQGIHASSVDEGSATANAISGVGYSDTGAAQAGSQFSSTGTFSSEPEQDNNNGGNDGGYDTGGGYSVSDDDFGGGGGGGDGGGGK